MSGLVYLAAAVVLGGVFLGYACTALAPLQRRAGARDVPLLDRVPAALFSALLVDHYWRQVF